MKKEGKRFLSGILILALALTGIMIESRIASAAKGTVKIYIGDSETARHHMAIALGSTSEEFRFALKEGEAVSSVYSSSAPSVFKIIETGTGKCKVETVAEGTGIVTLTIRTKNGDTLKEQVFLSVYTNMKELQAKAVRDADVYRGASSNAGMENEDKKGTLFKDKRVTVLAACGDYYLFKTNDAATYEDGKDSGFIKKSNLQILVSDITIQEKNISIKIGDNKKLHAAVSPDIAANPAISWKADNEKIAAVNSSGRVSGKAEGTTSITANAKDGSGKKAAIYVSVYKETKETGAYIKSNADLYAAGIDKNAIGSGKSGAKLTIVGTCGAYYYVRTDGTFIDGSYKGYCYIKKNKVKIPVTKVKLSKNAASLLPKGKMQLTAVVMPDMADNKEVRWSSSDSKIASVNNKGYVTAKKVGKATITAASADGSQSDKCEISVVENGYSSSKVPSKPSLEIETTGTSSVVLNVYNRNQYNRLEVYVNGKKQITEKLVSKKIFTSMSVYGFDINKTYKIKVKTYLKKKGKKRVYSKFSNTQQVTIGRTNINVNLIRNKSIMVSWKKIYNAQSYNIYRAKGKKGIYQLIKTVTGEKTSYTDKGIKLNKTYYYTVKPVDLGGVEGTGNIDYVKVTKLNKAGKYLAKKYKTICTDKKKNINSYNIKGTYSPVKYRFANGTLEIHVYLEFVTYSNTGKTSGDKVKIFKKGKASVKSEISASKYISMFKEGLKNAYNIDVKGGNGNFKKGIKFKTRLIIHDKEKMKNINANQKFVEVLIGGECPNCTSKGDHWYHAGGNFNASDYIEYNAIGVIYMPTNEQVRANTKKGYNKPADYPSTAAHELGHILGLADAYYDEEHGYDRCADNSETGYEYDKAKDFYDNLMKHYYFYKKINANGIEMMLRAVNDYTGIPVLASQCFKKYGDNEISDVIKNTKDEQTDKQ